jgi:hypothetical protein
MCKRVWYPQVVPREVIVYRRVPGSHTNSPHPAYFQTIGAPGFEPGTSCSQSRRATKLRYAPRGRVYGRVGRRPRRLRRT